MERRAGRPIRDSSRRDRRPKVIELEAVEISGRSGGDDGLLESPRRRWRLRGANGVVLDTNRSRLLEVLIQ